MFRVCDRVRLVGTIWRDLIRRPTAQTVWYVPVHIASLSPKGLIAPLPFAYSDSFAYMRSMAQKRPQMPLFSGSPACSHILVLVLKIWEFRSCYAAARISIA